MTIQEDIDELLQKLNRAADDRRDFRGEIIINAKGEAQFKVRVFSDTIQEMELSITEIFTGLENICRNKGIIIAGQN